MPTASKLIAALLFGALAWFVSDLVRPLLPEGTQDGLFLPVNGIVGLVIGWTIMGARAGRGMRAAFGYGITTALIIVFWCVFIWSGYLMVDASMKLRYDNPMQALQSMGLMMVDYARLMATPAILGSLFVGALLFGWLTDQVARRYP
jgi:hypothetical protein